MESKPVICVVVPALPPVDKYVAAKRVALDLGPFFRVRMAFCDVNIPTPEHYRQWDAICSEDRTAVLIDVGDGKYHKGFQSAAEMARLASSVEGGAVWNQLVGLANRNNETGFLKQFPYSTAKLIREAYHTATNPIVSQEFFWDKMMDVVNSFFWRQNRRDWNALFSDPKFVTLHRLWEGFNVQEKDVQPFTVPMYFRRLFMSGRPEADIIAKVTWWMKKGKQVQNLHAEARKKRYELQRFQVCGKPAFVAAVGNYFEAAAVSYQFLGSGRFALGVLRGPNGHAHIQPSFRHKDSDLSGVFAELDRREPTRWYYETRFDGGRSQMLMNGSWQFQGVTPTGLSDGQIQAILTTNTRWTSSGGQQQDRRHDNRATAATLGGIARSR